VPTEDCYSASEKHSKALPSAGSKEAQENRKKFEKDETELPSAPEVGPIRLTKSKVQFHKADQSSMPVTLDQGEGRCVIRLEGEINIGSAAELKKLLLQALACGRELRLDLEHATELDVTAWQLLWAAEREARGSSRGFTLLGQVPGEISAAVVDAGFETFPVGVEQK